MSFFDGDTKVILARTYKMFHPEYIFNANTGDKEDNSFQEEISHALDEQRRILKTDNLIKKESKFIFKRELPRVNIRRISKPKPKIRKIPELSPLSKFLIRTMLYEKEEREKEKKKEFIKNQIDKNKHIIDLIGFKKGRTTDCLSLRRDLAIYRLYKYCDYSPKMIASETNRRKELINRIIGDTFKKLCLSDNSCVFRDILSGKKEEENDYQEVKEEND